MDWTGQRICMVLTCNRPYYRKRREAQEPTYRRLEEAGFRIVLLLGDASLMEPRLEELSSRWTLTVPVEERYELLPQKIFAGLAWLEACGVDGVLKIDDDTAIHSPDVLLFCVGTTDYIGGDIGIIQLDEAADQQPLTYYGGPMYWVSRRSLQALANVSPPYRWEDVSVGYVLTKTYTDIVVRPTYWFQKGLVSWSSETEQTHGSRA